MADEQNLGVSGDGLLQILDRLGTRMDAGLSRIEAKLEGKADKADLARIESRMDVRLEEHSKEISRLKDQQRQDEISQHTIAVQKENALVASQRRWNYALSLALVLVSLFGVLAAVLHW